MDKIICALRKKIDTLCLADDENEFISAARSLLYYINHNELLSGLFSSNFNLNYDLSKTVVEGKYGCLKFNLPIDDDGKRSFILKFLDVITQENSNIGLSSFLVSVYADTHISNNYMKFSHYVVTPCTNLLLEKVMDYLGKNTSVQKSPEGTIPINVTINGNINGSNIALGNYNHQSVSSEFDTNQFRKDFETALIQHGIEIDNLAKISQEIKAFSEELEPSRQDASRLRQLLSSMKAGLSEVAQSSFKAVAIDQVKAALSNPVAVISLISSVF